MEQSPSLTSAYARVRKHFGENHQFSVGGHALRMTYAHLDLQDSLASTLEKKLGATLVIKMAGHTPSGNVEDLATGSMDSVGFVARRWGPPQATSLEIRLIALEEGQSELAAGELNNVTLDSLLASKGMAEGALTAYLAYRLRRLPPAKSKALAADLAGLLADYLSS